MGRMKLYIISITIAFIAYVGFGIWMFANNVPEQIRHLVTTGVMP